MGSGKPGKFKSRKKIGYYFRRFVKKVSRLLGLTETYEDRLNEMKSRGLKIGKDVVMSPGALLDKNYPYLISIGDNSVICTGVRLLAHDATILEFTGGYMRVGRIDIKENCIIGINSIILPGVTIGPNVLVASGSVVNKDIPPNTCVAGNPARYYSKFDAVMQTYKDEIAKSDTFKAVDIYMNEDEKRVDRKMKIIEQSKTGNVWIKGRESRNPKKIREFVYGPMSFEP
ncbi:MAG: acyltransferase [Thermoplasmatota archaeon]